tara:strand:+ start:516 stop:1025 length:510 start_codon:yes stop_codon:yes gene_type:complete
MQEKTLYLLRHGEANPLNDKGDLERSLTINGEKSLSLLLNNLCNQNIIWDLAICSVALRARQSLAILQSSCSKKEVIFSNELYNVSTNDVLTLVKNINDKNEDVLLVGHNPSLRNLALMLALDGGEKYKSLAKDFPPGSFISLKTQIKSWSNIQPRIAYIDEFFLPKTD